MIGFQECSQILRELEALSDTAREQNVLKCLDPKAENLQRQRACSKKRLLEIIIRRLTLIKLNSLLP